MNKIIISDTSCLIALSKIGKLHLLKELYQEITITKDVEKEFGEPLPDWVIVKKVMNIERQAELEKLLDKDEASSIAIASENKDSILIIDEIKGRRIAKTFQVNLIGTVGVIVTARKKGLITDMTSVLNELMHQGFRVSDQLLNMLKDKYGNM